MFYIELIQVLSSESLSPDSLRDCDFALSDFAYVVEEEALLKKEEFFRGQADEWNSNPDNNTKLEVRVFQRIR